MADIQKLYDIETFNPDIAEHESQPQETIKPGEVEELDGNYKKITINKKGIYVGENLEEIHLFVNKTDLDSLQGSLEEQIKNHPSREETYTQNQINSLLLEKANSVDVYPKTNTYNQTELNSKLNTKANVADTYNKIDSDRAYLKINDLPISVNAIIGLNDRTDLEVASKSPFKEDALIFTQDQYDKLSDTEKNNNKMYFIVDGTSEELLSSVKPLLTSGSVKVVRSGETLNLTFTLRAQVQLIASADLGTITVSGNTAIYKAPEVVENTPTVLHFKGSRNNLESQSLDIPITIMAVSDDVKVISFDGNSAAGGSMEPISIPKNEDNKWVSYLVDSAYTPQYNMKFKGWATDASDESTFLGSTGTKVEFDNANPITLYAIWENTNSRQCIIRYEANGGTLKESEDYQETVPLGKYLLKASNIFTPPPGKVFLYWSQSSLGNTGQVQAEKQIELRYAGEMTFFAIWGDINSDVFIQPDAPTIQSGQLNWVFEEQTQNIAFNANYVMRLHIDSDLAGNEVQIQGNVLIVKGIVPLSTMHLILYQTSGSGVDSEMTYFDVNVRETIPSTPITVENQKFETGLNIPLEIQFQNIDPRCQIKILDSSDTIAVTTNDNKVYVNSSSAKTITFKVSQYRTGVKGANLESPALDISVTVK